MINYTRIHINPAVMLGKPCIKGTRITVELILDRLAAGEQIEWILEAYPHITKEDILAAISYASDSIKHEKIYLSA